MRSVSILPLNSLSLAKALSWFGHGVRACDVKPLSVLIGGRGVMGAMSGMTTIAGAAATL